MDIKQRIGVLMGGVSSEREISLKSGKAVYEVLRLSGYDAVEIDIRKEEENYIKDLLLSYDLDLVFLALHGGFGEDGRLQGILEEIDLPFTGSGPRASFLAMNKAASRKIFKAAGLNVPKFCLLDKRQKRPKGLVRFPLVVKPLCGGSSIGLSIIDNSKDLDKAISFAFRYGSKIIIEEYIKGREMTVGILRDSALSPIEIKPKRRFFDYKAKYEKGETEYIVPARIPQGISRILKEAGLTAHKLLGCSFFSRVDIILDNNQKPFVLEINTIPGFTATSLLPMAAAVGGIDFGELVLNICDHALLKKNIV